MSVGEAEYDTLATSAAEGLAFLALADYLGYQFSSRIWVDSTTDKAILTRLRLGRVRLDASFSDSERTLVKRMQRTSMTEMKARRLHAGREIANSGYCRCDCEAFSGRHDGRS